MPFWLHGSLLMHAKHSAVPLGELSTALLMLRSKEAGACVREKKCACQNHRIGDAAGLLGNAESMTDGTRTSF